MLCGEALEGRLGLTALIAIHSPQTYLETRSVRFFPTEVKLATIRFHKVAAHEEPKPGSFAFRFRRNEGLKDLILKILRDTRTIIFYG